MEGGGRGWGGCRAEEMGGIPVASWMRASFKGCFRRPAIARLNCVL